MIARVVLIGFLLLAGCSGGEDAARRAEIAANAQAAPAAQRPDNEGPVRNEPVAALNPHAVGCLALALYHESRGEGEDGAIAVGHAILNRRESERYPSTVCDVVTQGGETPPCQFSFWCDGRVDIPREPEAYALAVERARKVLSGETKDPTDGATMFHTTAVSPYWASSYERTATIGRHVFYRAPR